jgi:hypothetical protein
MGNLSSTAARLANEIGLSFSGSPSEALRNHTYERVREVASTFGDVDKLDHLLELVANSLKVDLRFVRTDQDIHRIASTFKGTSEITGGYLRNKLNEAGTEGMLALHPGRESQGFEYLAIIDARADKLFRAYFTAWHEVVHVIITPHQLKEGEVRRTPPREKRSEPEEILVDQSAARVAFFERIFRSSLKRAIDREGVMSFAAIESAVEGSMDGDFDIPEPSLFASARACLRVVKRPACLLQVETMLKKKEKEKIESPQNDLFGFDFEPKPRVANLYKNEQGATLEIQKNMRVPTDSVIFRVHRPGSAKEREVQFENQSQWETSSEGALAPQPLTVSAVRRGSYTYGFLTARSAS